MAVCLGIFLWAGDEINTQLQEYQAARSEYAELREQIGVHRPAAPPSENGGDTERTDEAESIDFDVLRTLNPGTIGWIDVPDTGISYPLIQGSDNNRYLHHTFLGVRNNSGAIFLDYRNAPDFTDALTIVYGHNMLDGSMFAPLHGWSGDRFMIHTPDGTMEFEVFDRQVVRADDELFQFRDTPSDSGARVVMLSTCVTGQQSIRYVIQGRHIP
ncbi:MAG: class B sortase [Oscillospiraceae bacterium]|nr:class B sortase [Oscillospiraceae bacterium]